MMPWNMISLVSTCLIILQLLILHVLIHSISAHTVYMDPTTGYLFPKSIEKFRVRRINSSSHETVTTGRFELLGGFPSPLTTAKTTIAKPSNVLSLDEFKKVLQCAPHEPSLYERVAFMKMVPYTRKSVKLLAAWCEDQCPWERCEQLLPKLERGEGSNELVQCMKYNRGRLLRITNNTLFLDFPWKLDRFLEDGRVMVHKNIWEPIARILAMTRISDAVWLHGEERMGFFKLDFPLPLFTSSPSFKTGDMAWPWDEHLKASTAMYEALQRKQDFSDEAVRAYTGEDTTPWESRRPKAAFYGALTSLRSMVFHLANMHPGELEAFYPDKQQISDRATPWSPLSQADTEAMILSKSYARDNGSTRNISGVDGKPLYTGLLSGLERNRLPDGGVPKYWQRYKYVLVLEGLNGDASADRLGWLLAHSGAVVMLQTHFEYRYTFSARLVPYVHFIPISATGVDIIEKVRWLQANDHEAQKIVQNARNFGKSYLRLEDHYCYMATALEEVAKISGEFDANVPFGPMIDVVHNLTSLR